MSGFIYSYAECRNADSHYRQEEWPVSENVLKAKSPNLPNWTVNKNFYCTAYYITLNSNCEAQRASKKFEKKL